MSPDCTLGGLGVRFCFLLWLYVFLLRMPENLNMALVGTESVNECWLAYERGRVPDSLCVEGRVREGFNVSMNPYNLLTEPSSYPTV